MRVKEQGRLWRCFKRRELICFGHATRHDNHYKTILKRTLKSGRRHARQRKCWTDVTSKSGRPCHCRPKIAYDGLPQKRLQKNLLNHPSCLSDDPIGRGTDLTWPDDASTFLCIYYLSFGEAKRKFFYEKNFRGRHRACTKVTFIFTKCAPALFSIG